MWKLVACKWPLKPVPSGTEPSFLTHRCCWQRLNLLNWIYYWFWKLHEFTESFPPAPKCSMLSWIRDGEKNFFSKAKFNGDLILKQRLKFWYKRQQCQFRNKWGTSWTANSENFIYYFIKTFIKTLLKLVEKLEVLLNFCHKKDNFVQTWIF